MSNSLLLVIMLISFSHLSIAHTSNTSSLPHEVNIQGGKYYVGDVFGDHDYCEHATTNVFSYSIMKTEITYSFYQLIVEWARGEGYYLNEGCNGAFFEDCQLPEKDDGLHPVTNISWWDAILFANAYSSYRNLSPYYLSNDGKPLKSIPDNGVFKRASKSTSGYRLPNMEEWQIAARGGKKGIESRTYGAPFSGSTVSNNVANFPAYNATTFSTDPVASRHSNAAGIYDMSGNVSEWLDEHYFVDGGETMFFFCGGSYLTRASKLSSCDVHTPGFITPDTGFRLVRSHLD